MNPSCPSLPQLPDTPPVRPRLPLGSGAPVTAVPSRCRAPGAWGQPQPRSCHRRRDEAWVGPAELRRQPPGRAAARGAGPAPPPARPGPGRPPRALLTGAREAAGEQQQQQRPQNAGPPAKEPHGRGGAAGARRARSARCRARGGPGRGGAAGRAGAGRGEVRSSLSSFSRCFWAGWAAKRCCGRKGRRASGEMSVLHQVPHRWHPSGARSVCEHLWERGEIQGRRLRTVLTAGAVGRSVFQIPFNICQQSLNCVDLSSLLINIHLANTRVHCTRLPELPLLGPCVLLTVTQPPVVASEVTSANAVEASWNFSMYFQNCETDYKGDREKWKGITVFSYFNFFLSISNIKVMLGIYFSKDIC